MQTRKDKSSIGREHGINILQEAMFGKGILGVIEDVISKGEKEERKFWASYSILFFRKNVPKETKDEYKEERMKFEERLNKLMGDEAGQFWLEAFRYYQLYLDKRAKEIRSSAKDRKYRYKDLEEKYNRAIKVLKKLYFKKFIIFPFPFFVTRPPLDYPPWLTARKPMNLFIYCMGLTLRKYMKPTRSYEVIQDFLCYYLGYLQDDLGTIKKITKRHPFPSKD